MLVALAVVALALVAVVAAMALEQHRLVRRLLSAGRRLDAEVVATGAGLAEATSVVERVIDRALLRDDDTSLLEARLERALAMIPQGVVLFDADRSVLFANKAAAAYLAGRPGEALVEEAIHALADDVIAGRAVAPARDVELFGPPKRSLALRAVSMEGDPRGASVVVMVEDLTERRRLEAVRRDFVANVSHELKTPVGALGLLAETLVAEDDPAVARRLAERMLAEAFRVARTIDDLLELSRIETDEATVREPVPVHRVAAEAVERVQGAAEQRAITIAVDQVSPLLVVAGDRRQLVSAVYNLLDNAIKYSDPGSTVRLGAQSDDGWVDLSVEDHGTGIPPRDLDRIFERFYRVDRARSRETGGTGLGLAIVRHVASNHDGDVRVRSREGEGSTFTLHLPASRRPLPGSSKAG